jgi:hypothetical protein
MSLGAVSVHRARGHPAAVALLAGDAEVPELQTPVLAHEHVQGGEIAVEGLPAMQLAQHLENAGNFAPRRRFTPSRAAAPEERAEIAVARILEHQAIQNPSVLAHQRKRVVHGDGARMTVEQLPDVRLTQPAVDAARGLDAYRAGHHGRSAEPSRQVHLPESSLAEEALDAVLEAGFRADDRLARAKQVRGVHPDPRGRRGSCRRRR